MDFADGRITGQFALPAQCGHAGGIAHTGDRFLYVADSRHLFRIDTEAVLASGQCTARDCVSLPLRGALRGSALAYRRGTLVFAPYRKAGSGTARLWQVSEQEVITRLDRGAGVLDESAAQGGWAIADQTQGAAVAADDTIWLTQSSGRFGRLQKLDPGTGAVLASYAMPAGIEDIEFDGDGRLWAISEAGSQRWSGWSTFFPLVFSIDVGALR
jgi:sugar lactone lactonase YvrE